MVCPVDHDVLRWSWDAPAAKELFAVVGVLGGVRAELDVTGLVVKLTGHRGALTRIAIVEGPAVEHEALRPGVRHSGQAADVEGHAARYAGCPGCLAADRAAAVGGGVPAG